MKTKILTLVLAAAMMLPLAVSVSAEDKVAPPEEIAAPTNVTISVSPWAIGSVPLKISYDKDAALASFVKAYKDNVAAAVSPVLYAQIDWSIDAPDDWKYHENWDIGISSLSEDGEELIHNPKWEYINVPVTADVTDSNDFFIDLEREFNIVVYGDRLTNKIDKSVYEVEYIEEKGGCAVKIDWSKHYLNARVRYFLKYYPEGTTIEYVEADPDSFYDFVMVASNDPIYVISPWSEVVTYRGDSDDVSPFIDVAADAYYAKPAEWAIKNNITTSAVAMTFAPDEICTRAQVLTYLWRAAGCPESTAEMTFTDIAESDECAPAVRWAVEKGIIEDGTAFEPNTACTRIETVDYMWKYAGSPASETVPAFIDVTADTEEYNAVAWALEEGVTVGTTAATFEPEMTCTRGQIATFLWRAFAD